MKKYLFTILLALHFINAKSQSWIYHPMPDTNAVWRVDWWSSSASTCWPPGLYSQFQYTLGSDTTINGNTYKKIIHTGMEALCSPLPNYVNYYDGGLREDTINKKVYYIIPSNLTDTLIYDFSLNIGDTLHSYLCYGYDCIISSIDSVLVGSNFHKRFNLNTGYSFIEEVGGNEGLIALLCPTFEASINLICFSNNLDYYPASSSSCPLIGNTVNVSEISRVVNSLDIIPNPNNGIFKISFENNDLQKLEIYNIIGEMIYSNSIQVNGTLINLNTQPKGMYFVKAIAKDRKTFMSKILIN